MKITQYIKKLQKLANKYPKAEVIFDNCGEERYEEVKSLPTIGWFDGQSDFVMGENLPFEEKPNAICLN